MNRPSLCFDYEAQIPELRSLIARSERNQWVVGDIDWGVPPGNSGFGRALEWQGVLRSEYVRELPVARRDQLAQQLIAFEFSQILHGEQGAMLLAGQLVNSLEDMDAKRFAAIQTKDEGRHVEAVHKLVGRIGPIYPIGETLKLSLDELLSSDLWVKQVIGLQLFLEARALLSFRQSLLYVDDAVFSNVIRRIERDEAQHVAFGVRHVGKGLEEMSEHERAEMVRFASFVDDNVWFMTKSPEFRQPFEECDLDYDQFRATFAQATRWNLAMGRQARNEGDQLYLEFRRWFERTLRKVGLLGPGESLKGLERAGPRGRLEESEGDTAVIPWLEDEREIARELEVARSADSRVAPK
ncbi:MAG: ferritin-like domain-containing protein [Deltaproteobacteria bacterium]|nr:ferritin-like domain-containing protein [Deltaproteobacteria bacterium]